MKQIYHSKIKVLKINNGGENFVKEEEIVRLRLRKRILANDFVVKCMIPRGIPPLRFSKKSKHFLFITFDELVRIWLILAKMLDSIFQKCCLVIRVYI